MKIAVLTHFFPPEPCAAANRAEAIVSALVRGGHDVTVLTNFPSFPQGTLRAEDCFKILRSEPWHEARVLRFFTLRLSRLPGHKFVHWLASAFAMSAYLAVMRSKFDVILATIPPITLAAPALLAVGKGRKFILDVRDVFPDVAIAMGEWRQDGVLARITEAIARRLYRRADLIAGVTPAVVQQIARRPVHPEKLLLVTNGCDDFPELARSQSVERRLEAVYIGNLGLATDVEVIVDAAALMKNDPRIAITIVGDGAQARYLRERIQRDALRNIVLYPAVERQEAMRLFTNADVALVPLRKGITDSIPTKIFDALSTGCPILVCGSGEAEHITMLSGGGICVPPGNAAALVQQLQALASSDPAVTRAMGERGKQFVRTHYSRGTIMDGYCQRIANLQTAAT